MDSQPPGHPDSPTPGTPGTPGTPEISRAARKIQHSAPQIGRAPAAAAPAPPAADAQLLPMAEPTGPVGTSKKITAIERDRRHEDRWNRTPNTTGVGAIHVKTFHSKLTDDALAYMDQCINEWLDAHPQYEVKLVSSTVGTLTGKLKEPHLLCQVWV